LIFLILISYHKLPMIVTALLMGYLALALSFDWSILSVRSDRLKSKVSPIPRGLPVFMRSATPEQGDITEISWERIRGSAGRGGTFERYIVMVLTRNGRKPVALFDVGEREDDARAAAESLVGWLNRHRAKGLENVALRPS